MAHHSYLHRRAAGHISCSDLHLRPIAAGQAVLASHTTFGKPDLQGVWQALNAAAWDIQDHSGQRFPGLPARFSVPAGQGVVEGNDIPYLPWALEQKQKNFAGRLTDDPEARCYMPGVPRITYMPYPFQIFQLPDRVVILDQVPARHS